MIGVFLTDALPAAEVLRFFETAGLRATVLRELVFFFEGAFFFEAGAARFVDAFFAVFFLLAGVRFFETAFFAVFFLEVFFFEMAFFVVFFFEVFFLDAGVLFLDVRFFEALVRRALTAGRFFRLVAPRVVLRTEVFFFEVFFLVAAFFAGIVGLQARLNKTGDYTDARVERKACDGSSRQKRGAARTTGASGCQPGCLCSATTLV